MVPTRGGSVGQPRCKMSAAVLACIEKAGEEGEKVPRAAGTPGAQSLPLALRNAWIMEECLLHSRGFRRPRWRGGRVRDGGKVGGHS
eukprot:357690-Chlamydomonas_euryale.AAC.1